MRTMTPIDHAKGDIFEALGMSRKEQMSTLFSYLGFREKKNGLMNRSQAVEALCEVLETDEKMRRVVSLLAMDYIEEHSETESAPKTIEDKDPLRYALRSKYGLEPDEIEEAVVGMQALVKKGADAGAVLEEVGLPPALSKYLEA